MDLVSLVIDSRWYYFNVQNMLLHNQCQDSDFNRSLKPSASCYAKFCLWNSFYAKI